MKRMSDERLAEIGVANHWPRIVAEELYHALIAERALVERVKQLPEKWRNQKSKNNELGSLVDWINYAVDLENELLREME